MEHQPSDQCQPLAFLHWVGRCTCPLWITYYDEASFFLAWSGIFSCGISIEYRGNSALSMVRLNRDYSSEICFYLAWLQFANSPLRKQNVAHGAHMRLVSDWVFKGVCIVRHIRTTEVVNMAAVTRCTFTSMRRLVGLIDFFWMSLSCERFLEQSIMHENDPCRKAKMC